MNWKDRYREALVEVDPSKLLRMIKEAESAMTSRSECSPAPSKEELQEISNATFALRILKTHAMAGSV